MYILKAFSLLIFLYWCSSLSPVLSWDWDSAPPTNLTCSDSVPCPQGAVCINNRCTCPFPTHQLAQDDPNGRNGSWLCVSWVGGPCQEEVSGRIQTFPCTDNVVCVKSGGMMECACLPGYQTSTDRACKGESGRSCKGRGDCMPGLECWEGTCSCGGLEEWDPVGEACVKLVGALCSRDLDCTQYASCAAHWGSEKSCRCQSGFETTADRHCVWSPESGNFTN